LNIASPQGVYRFRYLPRLPLKSELGDEAASWNEPKMLGRPDRFVVYGWSAALLDDNTLYFTARPFEDPVPADGSYLVFFSADRPDNFTPTASP